MELLRTDSFNKTYASLPGNIQRLCDHQLKRLAHNYRDPRLHTKPLKGMPGVYSFRVTRRYRGLFYINKREQVVVFVIDNRKDVYR
jgi:mRNA-degrading endonuclease RelE of RelBE toxin-antitoxin system